MYSEVLETTLGELEKTEEEHDRRKEQNNQEQRSDNQLQQQDGGREEEEEEELERNVEEEVKKIREATNRRKYKKDESKLCNQWVWDRKCTYGERCRFTHKRLCRRLRKEGECNGEGCQDGHNLDGICRRYNSNEGCNKGSRYCRFLHIKVKKIEPKKERREDDQSRKKTREEDKPKQEKEEKKKKKDERTRKEKKRKAMTEIQK